MRRPRPNSASLPVIILGLSILVPGEVRCEDPDPWLPSWHIHGTNTLRFENYDVTGDRTSSPYSFRGRQHYDQFGIHFETASSPFNEWRGQVYGVVNDSDYRSPFRGVVPERIHIVQENGESRLPYRLELGDHFAYSSFRTIQRSLKGVQVDLQPEFREGVDAVRHSVMLTSGTAAPDWRSFKPTDDSYQALSWLMQSERFGRWNLGAVHNDRTARSATGTPHLSQEVYGLAGEKALEVGDHSVDLEGELDIFDGDHDGTGTPASGQDRSDTGLFFQLSGRGKVEPLTYRLRYEGYGQDFRPAGGNVQADRRSAESHVGYTFDSSLQVHGRFQNFRDGWESFDPTNTDTWGLDLSGPFFPGAVSDLTGRLSTFVQETRNRGRTIDTRTRNATLDLTRPLDDQWTGEFGGFFQQIDSHVPGEARTITRQARIGASRGFEFLGYQASVQPRLLFREIDGTGFASDDRQAQLAMAFSKEGRAGGCSLSHLLQDRGVAGQVETLSFRASFQWLDEEDTYGVEYGLDARNPFPGQDTDSKLIAIHWTRAFDKPIRRPVEEAPDPVTGTARPPAPGTFERGPLRLAELGPGLSLQQVDALLGSRGLKSFTPQGDVRIYETRFFDEIDQRQRLVLIHRSGQVMRSGVIVDPEGAGTLDPLRFTYERIRKELLDRYGSPTTNLEEGAFSPTLVEDVNAGTFIRITEWRTAGGTIRLGFPRRLDGRVRVEVQHARSFPPPNITLWSLEVIR